MSTVSNPRVHGITWPTPPRLDQAALDPSPENHFRPMAPTAAKYGRLVRVAKQAESVPETSRSDGRTKPVALRPIFLRGGVLTQARGSSYFEAGGTKVFCVVHGPRPAPASDTIDGSVACDLRWAAFARAQGARTDDGEADRRPGFMTDEERELSASLARTLSAVVRLECYPKSRIEVSAFVLEDDGSSFAAVVTAASMALVDAGIEMSGIVCGAAAAVVDGEVVLDPAAGEEERASGRVFVACVPGFGKVMDVGQEGEMEPDEVVRALAMCTESAEKIVELMRAAMRKQAAKLLKKRANAVANS